jgi:hypothetical protein
LSGLRPDDIEKASAGKGVASLRTLLVVNVLSALANEAHPLRRMLEANAELIDHLDAIATLRNRSAHGGEGSPELRDATRAHATVIEVVAVALGLSSTPLSPREVLTRE